MRLSKILFGFIYCFSVHLNAASFKLNGETIQSSITEKIIQCEDYKVKLINDHFPYKREVDVPDEFRISGYYGSASTVNKAAYILPSGLKVPTPNNIETLKGQFPSNRTYLPNAAVCQGSTLIISYGSGGNCKACEAFIQFTVTAGQTFDPIKVGYLRAKALQ